MLGNYVFVSVPKNAVVYIPCRSIWFYQSAWSFSNFIEFGEEPSVPANLNIADENNQFIITWEGDADSYKIFRNYDLVATVSTNSYTDTHLTNGINYCYKIIAVNEDCESDLSKNACKKFNGVGIVGTGRAPSLPSIYPNPTTEKFTVTHVENADLYLYNIVGQEVFSTYSTEEDTVVNVNFLPRGVYVLKVVKDGGVTVRKIVVSGK
jgi:hypothetical protein